MATRLLVFATILATVSAGVQVEPERVGLRSYSDGLGDSPAIPDIPASYHVEYAMVSKMGSSDSILYGAMDGDVSKESYRQYQLRYDVNMATIEVNEAYLRLQDKEYRFITELGECETLKGKKKMGERGFLQAIRAKTGCSFKKYDDKKKLNVFHCDGAGDYYFNKSGELKIVSVSSKEEEKARFECSKENDCYYSFAQWEALEDETALNLPCVCASPDKVPKMHHMDELPQFDY